MKYAVLVVDLLNDFITGQLKCERGQKMLPRVSKLLDEARKNNVPVIFCNDCHLDKVDFEFKLWGPHAIKGTWGAEIVDELKYDSKKDFIVEKRRFSGFFRTNLDLLLRELGVDTVILTGLHAHMCVRHTAADAYQNGFNVVLCTDCVDSFVEEDYVSGLAYIQKIYGATLLESKEIIKLF